MNKVFTFISCFLLLSSVCWAGGNKETNTKPSPQVQQPQNTPAPVAPARPIYWTGDGGKGKSITILPPKGFGIAENQKNLPDFVANELVSNFSTFSAMTLFDRVKNQRQYDELFSGIYADDDPNTSIGHDISTDYMLIGDITKTSTGYVLHLTVNSNSDKTTTAAYSGTVSIAELENLIGIRRASLELLQKMGITLTAQAQGELTKAATENRINAQTALAQGITAQRSGTVVEALTYYYQAASFDSSLLEAASRSSLISSAITSGNIGENVRNDIQRYNEWKKILDEADAFFKEHLPIDIVYNPILTQGKIDYNNQTVDLSFGLRLAPNDASFRVLSDLCKGLIETGKMKDWGFDRWPIEYPHALYIRTVGVSASLKNSDGRTIASSSSVVSPYINSGMVSFGYPDRSKFSLPLDVSKTITFSSVKADDITDTLTVQIWSVVIGGVDVLGRINIRTR